MEPVYRRERVEIPYRTRRSAVETSPYKKGLLKRAGICLLMLCVCVMIKTSQSPAFSPAQKVIEAVINTSTDFAKIPSQIGEFFHSLFSGEEEQSLNGKDFLAHLIKPVEAPITSPFGLRNDPTDGEEAFHYGLDLGAPQGDKIKCAANGTVEEAGENSEYGKFIIVRHSDTVSTLYAHCNELLPQAGDTVTAGQVIATVGATGKTTGPHLHFEIRDGETWLDPVKFLDFDQKEPSND